jgi:SAM-dependent methyltransferase
MTARRADRSARAAFQDRVLKITKPGSMVFDFGSGPGLDARFYAERGFMVGAYDVDPQMREYFRDHCREFIDSGQVALDGGNYPDFLLREVQPGARLADLVTSNFAPLNLVEDLPALFAKFHALTGPGGRILASVLNPYFVGDLTYGWWWRNAARLWRGGRFSVAGTAGPIIRRDTANFSTQCLPFFCLDRVFAGAPPSSRHIAEGLEVGGQRFARLHLCKFRYMFLLFRKNP